MTVSHACERYVPKESIEKRRMKYAKYLVNQK